MNFSPDQPTAAKETYLVVKEDCLDTKETFLATKEASSTKGIFLATKEDSSTRETFLIREDTNTKITLHITQILTTQVILVMMLLKIHQFISL